MRRGARLLVMDDPCAWWKIARCEEAKSDLACPLSWSPVDLKRSIGD